MLVFIHKSIQLSLKMKYLQLVLTHTVYTGNVILWKGLVHPLELEPVYYNYMKSLVTQSTTCSKLEIAVKNV